MLTVVQNDSHKTYRWWLFLCVTAILNIAIWAWVIWAVENSSPFFFVQAILSGVYVSVCAFRSFYPRIDLERYCLHDSPLSSVALGRTCATIAEVCFSLQCAIILYQLGLFLGSDAIVRISYVIVPLIVVAQIFCWHAMLTLNHFWHGLEEFAWVIKLILLAGCFAVGFFELEGLYQSLMVIGIISCLGCAWVMLYIDIPMYYQRWKQFRNSRHRLLNVKDGWRDAVHRRVHTSDWKIWKKEVVWITGYFTFGVWLSISMILVSF